MSVAEGNADVRAYLQTWLPGHGQSKDDGYSFPDVHQAFREAVALFASEMTMDSQKIDVAMSTTSVEEIQNLVQEALTKYSDKHKHSRARTWLDRVRPRLYHYSNVMDVFVQHHPEYVRLAWGAMKFIFIAAQNHESTICLLSEALSEIADALPRVELSIVLYPTERMKRAIGNLYAKLLRFFIRAYDWCHEGSFRHLLHSITRPPELRYRDLLREISENSQQIDQLAVSSSRVEIREMHLKLLKVLAKVDDIHSLTATSLPGVLTRLDNIQTLQANAHIDTNRRLDDIQLSQSISILSDTKLGDPLRALRFNQWLQRNRAQCQTTDTTIVNKFWLSPQLQTWTNSFDSGMAAVTGGFGARPAQRQFALNVIQNLQSNHVPTLWVLQPPGSVDQPAETNTVDIMKHIVKQALQLQQGVMTERDMSRAFARFENATTEEEWFQFLGSVLAQTAKQVYIVIDLYTLDQDLLPEGGLPWFVEFRKVFAKVKETAPNLRVKVLVLGGNTTVRLEETCGSSSNIVVPVRIMQTPVRRRKQLQQLRGGWL